MIFDCCQKLFLFRASIYKGGAECSAFVVFFVGIVPKTGFFDLILLFEVGCVSVDYKENALPCKKVHRRRVLRLWSPLMTVEWSINVPIRKATQSHDWVAR